MKHAEFFEIIDDIRCKRTSKLESVPAITLTKGIVFFHYVKAFSLLETIQILCQKNRIGESKIILRSLLNLYINLKWLTKENIDNRMQRYADFEIIGKKRQMDWANVLPNNEEEKRRTEELNENFSKIIKKYKIKPDDWEGLSRWSGKSIRKMAIDVDLLDDYEKIYSYLSFEEHTGPSTARTYLSDSENVISSYISKPDDFLVALILWTAISYYFQIEDIVSTIFDISFGKRKVNLTALANQHLRSAMQ